MRLGSLLLGSVFVATSMLLSCGGASGICRGEGGPVANWSLRPNKCKVGSLSSMYNGRHVVAAPDRLADLYRAETNASDTEVVVNGTSNAPFLLVRIPGAGKMVRLDASDCRLLDVSMDHTTYTVNDEAGLTGRARFDCTRPEIGHVTGDLSFTCF